MNRIKVAANNMDGYTEEEVRKFVDYYELNEINPFSGWKDYQLEALIETIDLLTSGVKNVFLDLPTGVGKSLINVMAAYAIKKNAEDWDGAFYTTPQKKLRNQLESDEDIKHLYKTLRARADYTCGVTGDDCKSCSIANSNEQSCFDQDGCTYVNHKQKAMGDDVAVLTFAYLIVDNFLPAYGQTDSIVSPGDESNGEQISFMDRDLIVVDEGHNLENQTASLHAGFTVSPHTVPMEVYQDAGQNVGSDPDFGDIESELRLLRKRCQQFVDRYGSVTNENTQEDVEDCQKMMGKIDYCLRERENGRHWVVETGDVSVGGNKLTKFVLKPAKVDEFLKNFVWSRGKKRIISTATVPYRGNLDKLCDRLGLDPHKSEKVSYTMPFDKSNRPIVTGTEIGKFSKGREDDYWPEIMEKLNDLARKHRGERGIIHCSSYDRGERVHSWANNGDYEYLENNIKLHYSKESGDVVESWQRSDKDIIVTPSMMEGVDLYDDRCRWGVLLKVPYPNPYNDARANYLLEEENDWQWYNETTALQIVQSVGRAVRNKDDHAVYYVLDECFEDICRSVNLPDWFEEAIVDSYEQNQLFGHNEAPSDTSEIEW